MRTILIDCDLRRQASAVCSTQRWAEGLIDVLKGTADDPEQYGRQRLCVLPLSPLYLGTRRPAKGEFAGSSTSLGRPF
jgi:hypothetical protein